MGDLQQEYLNIIGEDAINRDNYDGFIEWLIDDPEARLETLKRRTKKGGDEKLIRVGQYVTIFQDPLSQTKIEGEACIREVGETKGGLTKVVVRFMNRSYKDYYERYIRADTPTPLTEKEQRMIDEE